MLWLPGLFAFVAACTVVEIVLFETVDCMEIMFELIAAVIFESDPVIFCSDFAVIKPAISVFAWPSVRGESSKRVVSSLLFANVSDIPVLSFIAPSDNIPGSLVGFVISGPFELSSWTFCEETSETCERLSEVSWRKLCLAKV